VQLQQQQPPHNDHFSVLVDKWQTTPTGRKRRQRVCKVCSILKREDPVVRTSASHCSLCVLHNGILVFLCTREKRDNMTCFQIWHELRNNGQEFPVTYSTIRAREDRADPAY
jgi:hypothetical protein